MIALPMIWLLVSRSWHGAPTRRGGAAWAAITRARTTRRTASIFRVRENTPRVVSYHRR